ncbi:MAG: hypothetical protein H8E76_03095 [Helicobacteraceae bacterium]|nr:hypothetical protein [Candidatus Sulfurimonas ponti]MBL6973002.1 hypothetical protein [Sulfurimonas sp.]
MRNLIISLSVCTLIHASQTSGSWLKDGNVSGNLKYYYIETNKNYITGQETSHHSNAIGGQLKYKTKRVYNILFQASFMTTHGFLLPENVESSTLGQDEGKKGWSDEDAYSVLGEVNLDYKNKYFNLWYGRKLVNTPMIGPKSARMLPSTIEGGEVSAYVSKDTRVSLLYADKFKQRTAKNFTNIIKHALGSDTYAVTGSDEGSTYTLHLQHLLDTSVLNIYNMYAPDFLNAAYVDFKYTNDFYTLAAQAVQQVSVGNANTNLAKTSSITNGKKINATAFGLQVILKHKQSSLDIVYRNILRDKNAYDSIITPWDGSLLYAYSSTTNNLGQSLYGNALTAGGAYVGGTQGLKFGYTQKYTFLGLKGFKTHLAYAVYKNDLYREDQEDLKAILFYDNGPFSVELKGIWIDNDTYTFKDGTVNQLDSLTQYHAIVNYNF